ncbi:MAG TPA: hypothetical protein VF228_11205 [Iamia sp.]
MTNSYATPVPAQNHQPAVVATPTQIGQATFVEQSRAVAEVQAAVLVAQSVPRNIAAVRDAMRQSCGMTAFAERAFYRYPRGGQTVTGGSVYLARELARCWGNIQYDVGELRRDDRAAESEMRAWAWDVQTNARSSLTFIVPHKRDRTGGPVVLSDMRDIYENNANMGARRLREAIFSILPVWFTEEAKDLCQATIRRGDGTPLADRISAAIAAFDQIGVTQTRLEQKLGRASDRWNEYDIAQLLVTHRSIERREIAIDDEFPPPKVTASEARGDDSPPPVTVAEAAAPPAAEPAKAEEPAPTPEPEPAATARPTSAAEMKALLKKSPLGYGATVTKVDETIGDGTGALATPTAILNDPQALDFALALIEGREQ